MNVNTLKKYSAKTSHFFNTNICGIALLAILSNNTASATDRAELNAADVRLPVRSARPVLPPARNMLPASPVLAPNISTSIAWVFIPGGSANDVGIGSNGDIWAIGTNPIGNSGYGIYRISGLSWQQILGGAVRIDVDPQGIPWVVNRSGNVYKRNSNNGWDIIPQLNNLAEDIGIGADGSVWVAGKDKKTLYQKVGQNWLKRHLGLGQTLPQHSGGNPLRIDVDPQGNPWIINNATAISKFDVATQTYKSIPGRAFDIGISQGAVWRINSGPGISLQGNNHISKWENNTWGENIPIGAANISVHPNGKPWVSGHNKTLTTLP